MRQIKPAHLVFSAHYNLVTLTYLLTYLLTYRPRTLNYPTINIRAKVHRLIQYTPVPDRQTDRRTNILFKIKAKGQYWPLTCNTNHDTMFDMQEVSIKTNSNMYKPN